MMKGLAWACCAALALLASVPAAARTEVITVHGAALEGNLEGNSPDRQVYVFLPPSYDGSPDRRYPVVYFLHGYFATATAYDELVKFQEAVDEAAAAGNEMIVVLPDTHTKFKGAMYGASVTTGDFPRFVAEDLVAYVDAHYRTIAEPESRGLSGHSMGGMGTLRIAMTHPGVFSSIYAMAPCCVLPANATVEQIEAAHALTDEQIEAAGFGQAAGPATYAAWAPDPTNPPHFFSRGVTEKGEVDRLFLARLAANAPAVMLPQHLPELKRLEAIRLEVGDKDFLLQDDTRMHEELERFGVAHEWKIFDGDHGNRVAERIRSELLPFFGEHLDR